LNDALLPPPRHTVPISAVAGATAYVGVRALVERQPTLDPVHEQRGPVPQMLPLAAGFGVAVLVHIARNRFTVRR
jgi:hypothetical protein